MPANDWSRLHQDQYLPDANYRPRFPTFDELCIYQIISGYLFTAAIRWSGISLICDVVLYVAVGRSRGLMCVGYLGNSVY